MAVKTGTTNNYKDAWTVGYTPNLVVGIWAGNNDNTSMTHQVSGFIVGPMWNKFMNYVLPTRTTQYFTRTTIDESNLKPILRGQWQTPGSDGALHEILYWLNKNDPTGPTPADPTDPQYSLWETGLSLWLTHNTPAGLQPASTSGQVQTTQGLMIPVGPAQ